MYRAPTDAGWKPPLRNGRSRLEPGMKPGLYKLGVSVLPDDDGGRGENGAELASGERLQGAQAGGKFRGG